MNTFLIIIGVLFLVYFLIKYLKKEEKKAVREYENYKHKEIVDEKVKEDHQKIDEIQSRIEEIENMEIVEISSYKQFVIDNEATIYEKGGDNVLHNFLKIDSFLNSYRNKIIDDRISIKGEFSSISLKNSLKFLNEGGDGLYEFIAEMQDYSNIGKGKPLESKRSNFNKLIDLSQNLYPTFTLQNKTLEYYGNIALAMVLFYLNGNRIKYFEIYEAFDKLGVFNNHWENSVLNKLSSIEDRLDALSNELVKLNHGFQQLVEHSDSIINELEKLNNNVVTNTMIASLNTYQNWRIKSKLS